MASYASNTPISRPVHPGWTSDWDLNGLQWSNEFGLFYAPENEMEPMRRPVFRTQD